MQSFYLRLLIIKPVVRADMLLVRYQCRYSCLKLSCFRGFGTASKMERLVLTNGSFRCQMGCLLCKKFCWGLRERHGTRSPQTSSGEKKDDHLEVAAKKGESNLLLSPKILAMDQRSPFQDEISADISSTSAQHANALSGAGADAQRAGLKSQEPGR